MLIRSQKVIVDADLALLYGVPTKRLNEQVKRNLDRFPSDFMFVLTAEEKAEVVANCDHLAKLKYAKILPFVQIFLVRRKQPRQEFMWCAHSCA
jgi:hypothetical protein